MDYYEVSPLSWSCCSNNDFANLFNVYNNLNLWCLQKVKSSTTAIDDQQKNEIRSVISRTYKPIKNCKDVSLTRYVSIRVTFNIRNLRFRSIPKVHLSLKIHIMNR